MRKIISFILALAMALSMVACGGSGSENTGDSTGTQATPQPTPAPKVLSDTLTISKYDDEKITNDYTGLEFTLTDTWSMIDRDKVCPIYMKNVTGRQLEAMTADELNRHAVIADWAVNDSNGIIVLATVVNYEKTGITFTEYLDLFIAINTKGSYCVSDEETVILSGVEYQNITAFYEDNVVDICYKDRGDGHMAVVTSNLGLYCTPQYVHAFFNGGPDTETDIENVPGLFSVDSEKWRVKNDVADIEIDIPDGWITWSKNDVAKLHYFTTEERLNSMTPADFARLNEINDITMSDDKSTTSVNISYVNRNHPAAYGLSCEEMQLLYRNLTNRSVAYANTYDNVSFAGQSYYCTKIYYRNTDKTFLFLFREINKDYIAKVVIASDGDCQVSELRKIFDDDNDTDMLIKRSRYIGEKYQFHNRYTDVRINILKSWERNDRLLFKALNNKNLSEDQVAAWTDEDYMNSAYIPDFAVSSEDQTTSLVVYYVNLNKIAGGKPDVNSVFDTCKTTFEKKGYITVEDNCLYSLGGYDYLVYKSTTADGKTNMQFATAEISDDYVIMLTYVTPIDSEVPDITGTINDR